MATMYVTEHSLSSRYTSHSMKKLDCSKKKPTQVRIIKALLNIREKEKCSVTLTNGSQQKQNGVVIQESNTSMQRIMLSKASK